MRLAPLTAVVVLLCAPLVVQATPLEMVANGSFEEELDGILGYAPEATYRVLATAEVLHHRIGKVAGHVLDGPVTGFNAPFHRQRF